MTARYRHCGVAMVRSTTDPGGLPVPDDLDPGDEGTCREWLAGLWARDDVREALTLASPDLARGIIRILSDSPGAGTSRELRRVVLSAVSYMRRWQGRATPFGLFAGVTLARVGPAAARTGTAHQAVARPDGEWLAAVTRALELDPDLRPRLTVVASTLATVRDGRLFVPCRAAPDSPAPGPLRDASVRWTRPVRHAIDLATSPIELGDLAGKLAAQFPDATPEQVTALLDGLADEGFLITSLRAPMTAEDPLAHLTAALRAAGAADLPAAASVLGVLEGLAGLLRAHNACTDPGQASAIRAAAVARMRGLAPAGRPVMVDVRLDADVIVPARVLDEAAAAASVLLRLTTRPFGSMAWMEYQARFLERYGPGALVPVRDLLSASGLGYPDGYLGTPRARPGWRLLTERDAALLAMIQQAVITGDEEIVLTEEGVKSLVIDDQGSVVPPPRGEIGVSVHAASAEAVNHGDFELRLTAVPRSPTSMAGRFAHLLAPGERDRLAAVHETGEAGVLPVQLSFPPRKPRTENVTRVAPLVPAVLPIGEHPGGDEAIRLDELAVTADAAQLYLVHVPTGRRIVPVVAHALELKAQAPPMARFIAEVAAARSAVLGPLDLGAARALPYVPRIRYRRTVLSPARWLATRDGLAPGRAGWDERLAGWRRLWRVPTRVVACHGELRLPLDLARPADRALLAARLQRDAMTELREDAAPGGNGWPGRPTEFLVPLTVAVPAHRPLPVTCHPGAIRRPGGSDVVCARITGSPARFDDIIASHLPALMANLVPPPAGRWWLRRYRDLIHPAIPQHVEVCIRLADPGEFAGTAAALASLAAGLEARSLPGLLTLATSAEQPGRYGHGKAMEAAERVFAADTVTAIAQLAMSAASGVPGQALAAASMAQLAAAFGPDPVRGYQALASCLEQGSGPLDPALRDHARRLANPADDFAVLRALPGGIAVADAWLARGEALAAYRQALTPQRDPGSQLRLLLHEHHMRAIGVDPAVERETGRLARAAALRCLALAGRP